MLVSLDEIKQVSVSLEMCVCVQLFSFKHGKCYGMVVLPNILSSTTYLFGILRYLLKCVCERVCLSVFACGLGGKKKKTWSRKTATSTQKI